MKPIRTILVDDEPLAIRGLKIRLQEFEDIEIIDTAVNGREAIKDQTPTPGPAVSGYSNAGTGRVCRRALVT